MNCAAEPTSLLVYALGLVHFPFMRYSQQQPKNALANALLSKSKDNLYRCVSQSYLLISAYLPTLKFTDSCRHETEVRVNSNHFF